MDNEVGFKKMNKKYKECFIKECVLEGRIFWTYHVNMRLRERNISLEYVTEALTCCSIIEEYPEDAPLPTYLVFGYDRQNNPLHIVVAVDEGSKNIRIVTSYKPSLEKWKEDFKTRRR
jgi:hypothetical protein